MKTVEVPSPRTCRTEIVPFMQGSAAGIDTGHRSVAGIFVEAKVEALPGTSVRQTRVFTSFDVKLSYDGTAENAGMLFRSPCFGNVHHLLSAIADVAQFTKPAGPIRDRFTSFRNGNWEEPVEGACFQVVPMADEGRFAAALIEGLYANNRQATHVLRIEAGMTPEACSGLRRALDGTSAFVHASIGEMDAEIRSAFEEKATARPR